MRPKGHKPGCGCVVCSPKKRRRKRRNHGYENQAATLHERAGALRAGPRRNSTVPIGGTVRGRSAALRPRTTRIAGNPADRELADELVLYAENTGELYPLFQATQKSLMSKRARGDFDILKAGKAWMNVVNRAAQMYTREYGSPRTHGSYGPFSVGTRSAAAGTLMSHFSTGAAMGEYDYLLPKKYRKNTAHYPRTSRGPKGNVKWYILDLFDARGGKVDSRYKKCARAKCATDAAGLVNRKIRGRIVRKVELSGPYSRKPNANTVRK